MEWKSSTHKKKYGDVIGEVKHHTLYEDGSITHYDVQFENKLVRQIPAKLLGVVKMQEHKHGTSGGRLDNTSDEEDE